MQLNRNINGQTRGLIMALGGAALAAVAAMFVPTGVWEAITGSTGISEMVPATAAPLGDTARAMIAFGVGALTFAVLAAMLLRKNAAAPFEMSRAATSPFANEQAEAAPAARPSLVSRMQEKLAGFAAARRNGDDITGLEDLPKLRNSDAHPDAPPRRPLSAELDLADPVAETQPASEGPTPMFARAMETLHASAPLEEPVVAEPAVIEAEVVAEASAAEVKADPVLAEAVQPEPVAANSSLTAIVERLETALAERAVQLARLESLAANLPDHAAMPEVEAVIEEVEAVEVVEVEEVIPAPVFQRPPLEAVELPPRAEAKADDMDAALRSALETLHRMNARNH
jgi:translation elongation factor EF-1beta